MASKGSVKWSIIDETAGREATKGSGGRRRAGVTDLVREQLEADIFEEKSGNAKKKAVREVSEEPGWIPEWDDDLVLSERPRLNDRLAWIDANVSLLTSSRLFILSWSHLCLLP